MIVSGDEKQYYLLYEGPQLTTFFYYSVFFYQSILFFPIAQASFLSKRCLHREDDLTMTSRIRCQFDLLA